MSQIICKDIVLGYDGRVVLKDLNFNVERGDYLCIIGSNGTGKTTLMKAILGLKKQMSGNIIWGDGINPNEVGYLTQQNEIQKDFPASVREVVISGFQSRCGWRPFYNKEEKEQAKLMMKKMGIESLEKRCYRELSGGQQQRVLLARALCATQRILFLDEPATGLDSEVCAEMYGLIKKLNEEEHISVIMISHDIEISLKYATHILQIGENPFFGTKKEYLHMRKEFLAKSLDGGILNE